jgi:hypothetical protein
VDPDERPVIEVEAHDEEQDADKGQRRIISLDTRLSALSCRKRSATTIINSGVEIDLSD